MTDRKPPKPVRAMKPQRAWAIVRSNGRFAPCGGDALPVYGSRRFARLDSDCEAGERVIRVTIAPETSDA